MDTDSRTAILSDLVRIQSDRASEYKRLAGTLSASDLDQSTLLTRYAEESRRFVIELKQKLKDEGQSSLPAGEGELYNRWKKQLEAFRNKPMTASEELPAMERLSAKLFSEVLKNRDWPPVVHQFLRNQRDALAETGKMLEDYYGRHPMPSAHE